MADKEHTVIKLYIKKDNRKCNINQAKWENEALKESSSDNVILKIGKIEIWLNKFFEITITQI